MIRVLIIDDHPIFRQGLVWTISNTPNMVVAGESNRGEDALNKIEDEDFDVVLLDISMPGMNCFDIIKGIKKTRPNLPMVILTMHPEEQYAVRMLKAGASGYLTKGKDPKELIDAIHTVTKGKKYISSSITELVTRDWGKDLEKPLHQNLSNREFEIMCMIVSGKKVSQIAKELVISVKTVKTHRSRLLLKMNMTSNAQLFHYTIKHHLVDETIN